MIERNFYQKISQRRKSTDHHDSLVFKHRNNESNVFRKNWSAILIKYNNYKFIKSNKMGYYEKFIFRQGRKIQLWQFFVKFIKFLFYRLFFHKTKPHLKFLDSF